MQTIIVTPTVVGSAIANTNIASLGKDVEIPTYDVMVVDHETGYVVHYDFTRDSTLGGVNNVGAGNYDTNGEATPGNFVGIMRPDGKLMVYDPTMPQNQNTDYPMYINNPVHPDKPRFAIEFHNVGCSAGCLMSYSADNFNQYVRFMQQQDIAQGVDPTINVIIQDRNN